MAVIQPEQVEVTALELGKNTIFEIVNSLASTDINHQPIRTKLSQTSQRLCTKQGCELLYFGECFLNLYKVISL